MDEWIESLKPMVAILGLCFFVATLFAWWKFSRSLKNMDSKSTAQLKAIITDPRKRFLFGPAIQELRKRDEDYSAALPYLLDMAVSKTYAERLIGWGILSECFPEIVEEIDYEPNKPSKESRELLKSLRRSEFGDP